MAICQLEIYGCMNHPYEFLSSFLGKIGMGGSAESTNEYGDRTFMKDGREVTLSAEGREYGEMIAKISRDVDTYGGWSKKKNLAVYERAPRPKEIEIDLGDWLA